MKIKFLFIALLVLGSKLVLAKDKVLVVTRPIGEFKIVVDNVYANLKNKYEVIEYQNLYGQGNLNNKINEVSPDLLVVLDNPSVRMVNKYFKNSNKSIPTVVSMGLNFEQDYSKAKNFCGIAYEVSPIKLINETKKLLPHKKINKVLTFYRGNRFRQAMTKAEEMFKNAKVQFTAIDLDKAINGKSYTEFLESNGKWLIDQHDVVIVQMDSKLITADSFFSTWKKLSYQTKTPFVIGTNKLARVDYNFAVLGMGPELSSMGEQIASMSTSILDGSTNCENIGIVKANNFKTTWNQRMALEINVNSFYSSNKKYLTHIEVVR